MNKGKLLYTSSKFKFEIHKQSDLITVSGIKGKSLLNTYNIEKVNSEMKYINGSLYFLFAGIGIFFIINKELYCHFVLDMAFSRWLRFVIIFGIGILINIVFINKGFHGLFKFINDQEDYISISKKEFNIISSIILKEIQDDLQRESSTSEKGLYDR